MFPGPASSPIATVAWREPSYPEQGERSAWAPMAARSAAVTARRPCPSER